MQNYDTKLVTEELLNFLKENELNVVSIEKSIASYEHENLFQPTGVESTRSASNQKEVAKQLMIYSHNVSGANGKMSAINNQLATTMFNIVLIQETWLTEQFRIKKLLLFRTQMNSNIDAGWSIST